MAHLADFLAEQDKCACSDLGVHLPFSLHANWGSREDTDFLLKESEANRMGRFDSWQYDQNHGSLQDEEISVFGD